MYLLKLLVEICIVMILTTVSARPHDDHRHEYFDTEDKKQQNLKQFNDNRKFSSYDEQLRGFMQGLQDEKGDTNKYFTKNLGDNYQLNEHVNEESKTNHENHVESEQYSGQRPKETYSDTVGPERNIDELEQLPNSFKNKNETVNLNTNVEDEIKQTNPSKSSINEREDMSLDNPTEVSDEERNIKKTLKEPSEQSEYEPNDVNNKGIKNQPDKDDDEHERQTYTKVQPELPQSNEKVTNIKEEGEWNDDGKLGVKHTDKSNIMVDNKIIESHEQLTTIKRLDKDVLVKTTIQKNVEHENVPKLPVMNTSPSTYFKVTDTVRYSSVTETRNVNFNINDEKIEINNEAKSTARSLDVVNDKTVHTSDELSGRTSDHAKGSGARNTDVENRKVSSITTKEKSIEGKELTKDVSTEKDVKVNNNKNPPKTGYEDKPPFEDHPIAIKEVTVSHDSFITKDTPSKSTISSKTNEETFTDRGVTQHVGNNNDPLVHPGHPPVIDEVTEDIKHDIDDTNEEKKNEHSNHEFVTLTSDVSDNVNRDNKGHHTPENVPKGTGSVMEKDANRIANKDDPVNNIPLSFHPLEGKAGRLATKQNYRPTKTPVQRSKLDEMQSNDPDLLNQPVLENEDNVVEDIERNDDKPCNYIRDPELMYNGSALIAATVGGVFIGGFVVLLLFKARDRCKSYVQGDYRRVPMEYDFELNPRFKTH